MAVRKLSGAKINDRVLIELVRQRPELYDVSHPKYGDTRVKDNIWIELGRKLKADGASCKLRWNNIRDQYRKRLKEFASKTACAEKVRVYKYSEQLSFLAPFFKEKEIAADVSSIRSEEGNTDVKEHNILPHSVDPLEFIRPRTFSQSSRDSQSSMSSNNPLGNLSKKATESLVQYLLKKHEAEINPHPIDAFLAALAPVLKTLSPYHQHLAKGELFAVVQKYERKKFSETTDNIISETHQLTDICDG